MGRHVCGHACAPCAKLFKSMSQTLWQNVEATENAHEERDGFFMGFNPGEVRDFEGQSSKLDEIIGQLHELADMMRGEGRASMGGTDSIGGTDSPRIANR